MKNKCTELSNIELSLLNAGYSNAIFKSILSPYDGCRDELRPFKTVIDL